MLIKFIPVLLILIVFQCLYQRYWRPWQSYTWQQRVTVVSANIYAWCALVLVFMPALFPLSFSHFHYQYVTVGRAIVILKPYQVLDSQQFFNILMTFPAGVYFALFSKKATSWKVALGVAIGIGLMNEGGQFLLDQLVGLGRSVAGDDLINNGLGVLLGYIVSKYIPLLVPFKTAVIQTRL